MLIVLEESPLFSSKEARVFTGDCLSFAQPESCGFDKSID